MTTRREFLHAASAAVVLSPALLRGASDPFGPLLPQRVLGKTGEKVTAFGLGGHHVGIARDEKHAEELIECAMECGVRFFDNAVSYGGGLSETYYGRFLTPKYREHVFVTTKTKSNKATEARKEFEDSLRRLKTDRVDLWQIHAIGSVNDVKGRIEGGVLDLFLEMREKKKARYIGFSGHTSQEAMCYMLDFCKERGYQMDACLMPVNIAETHYDSYLVNVLPKLQEQGVALLAMKSMTFGGIFKHADKVAPGVITPENLHGYAYSLPVACLISGCETVEQIKANTAILRNFTGMDEECRKQLVAAVENIAGPDLETYKRRI